jgi:hypothetical protein
MMILNIFLLHPAGFLKSVLNVDPLTTGFEGLSDNLHH